MFQKVLKIFTLIILLTGIIFTIKYFLTDTYDTRPIAWDRTNLDLQKVLILYDTTGDFGWLGENYAIAASNLSSHFAKPRCIPVDTYTSGDINQYHALIYIGSTLVTTLPKSFLDDIIQEKNKPIIWMNSNIGQLAKNTVNFKEIYGFYPLTYDNSNVRAVKYKDVDLSRNLLNKSGIMTYSFLDKSKVKILANAMKEDGSILPWAIRTSNLTYIGELPFTYISETDRYLIFCDLLFDALDPSAKTRHRAMIRLEDVAPNTDPIKFRKVVDYLYKEKIPFSLAIIPLYKDPLGSNNNGKEQSLTWKDRPKMLKEVKYALKHGGTLIMHGYSHQLNKEKNPYSGLTASDYEFFRATIDDKNNVKYLGAVPMDSPEWALGRIDYGLLELKNAGLPLPQIFEYPHYLGSPTDSRSIATKIKNAYQRGEYFSGSLGTSKENLNHSIGQFFPYTVTDIYGFDIMPENLGNIIIESFNNNATRSSKNIVEAAEKNLVIRDGFASFFFHPYLPLEELKNTVKGIQSIGYEFIGPHEIYP